MLFRSKPALSSTASSERIDQFIEKEFIRSLFGLSVQELRRFCESRGKQIHFRLFEIYDLEDDERKRAGYSELAREFGIAVTDVTNYLAFARREFPRIALE